MEWHTQLVENDILVVAVKGPYSPPEERLGFFANVATEARRVGVTKVMIDARESTGDLRTMDRFQYGELAATYLRPFKLAFVIRADLLEPARFGETVAVNRGGNVRVFGDANEARAWLDVDA